MWTKTVNKLSNKIETVDDKVSDIDVGVTSVNGQTGDVTVQEYSLPDATSSTLGGVKVGSNITVSSGTISLTKANVTDALGYTPLQTAPVTSVNGQTGAVTVSSDDKLPLSGGTMTGIIYKNGILGTGAKNGWIGIQGGPLWQDGAYIYLDGNDAPTIPGHAGAGGFLIRANNNDTTLVKDFIGHSNGTLKFGSQHIVRSVNSTNADASGNVSLNFVDLNTAQTIGGNKTFSGVITTASGMYTDSYTSGALNLSNSNIVGINSLYFCDASDDAKEGIQFYNSTTKVDTLWSKNGVLYYTPNRPIGENGTAKTVQFTDSPVYDSYISFGGKSLTGTYSPIDAGLNPRLGANRFAFLKPAGITFEYSRNGGSTWTAWSRTDEEKLRIFSNTNSGLISLGNDTNKLIDKSKYMSRVTINAGGCGVYSEIKKLIMYVTTNGSSGSYCTVECRTQENFANNVNTWETLISKHPLSGWSGYNVINLPSITFGTNDWSKRELRLTFGVTSHASTVDYSGLQIQSICAHGGVGWGTPSTMAATGSIYSWDYAQNATFPAQVTATNFNGKWQNANKTVSTSAPSGGSSGDIWFQYIA